MRTNRTPFCDVVCMITADKQENASGHYKEDLKGCEILCSVCDGVSRAEFYEAAKSGVELSITVEIWEDDYGGELQLCYEGKLFDIKRVYPTGHGTIELSCAEVKR